jgi:STE24 endopeptidase
MDRVIPLKVAVIMAASIIVASSLAAHAQELPAQRQDAATAQQDGPRAADAAFEQVPVEVPRPTEKAMRYYESGMRWWALTEIWALLLPGLIAFSGLSARLRNLARRLGRWWFPTVGLYVVFYLALVFLIDLPLAYYLGFVRQHAYGLSNQTLAKWSTDAFLRLGVEMAVGFALAWVPYLLIARSPRRWWVYTTLLCIPFLFVSVLVKPIWIDPLFNEFGPMKNKVLEQSILDLASRAGIEGSRVFEVNKSVDTKAVNAYVTGVFNTKRIVLWDTLIARLDEKELLVVMAHEMGHYVLGHVSRSILLSSLVILAGLFFVNVMGRRLIARYSHLLGFDSLSDIASAPIVLMLIQLSSLVLTPVAFAYSRFQEHEADRFALDLTHANHSGAMAFVKLQEENLSNPRPGLIYKIFRATHPSIGDRIDFCNSYHPSASRADSRLSDGEP